MTQTVIGIFRDDKSAHQAVEQLVAEGYDKADIDVSSQINRAGYGGTDNDQQNDDGLGEKITKFFNNLFDDGDESERYSNRALNGSVVSVQALSSEMSARAAEILDRCGAIDVDNDESDDLESMSSDRNTTFGASISPGTPVADLDQMDDEALTSSKTMNDDLGNRSIPVIEEDLQVGKREVERGGVRLRSRIVERPVEEHLRLREEHVSVDRTPANRAASPGDLDTFKEGEIEIRERAEVPVVNKEARVVEEINLRKDVREREETVRDTVRKTEIEVDKIEDSNDDLISSTRKSSRSKK
jgi:stress response protein YsnF